VDVNGEFIDELIDEVRGILLVVPLEDPQI
jgi:hypothetical protein